LIDANLSAELNVSHGENVSSFTELFRRYVVVKKETFTGSNTYTSKFDPYGDNIGDIQPLFLMLRTFHYRRGSFRVQAHIVNNPDKVNIQMYARNYYINDDDEDNWGLAGYAYMETNTRPWISVQIPFYYQYDMVCNSTYAKEVQRYPGCRIDFHNGDDKVANFECEVEWWVSLGDDFSIGWPAVPVPLRTGPTLTNKKKKQITDKNNIPKAQMSEQDEKTERKTQSQKFAKKTQGKIASVVAPVATEAASIVGLLNTFGGALMDKPTDLQAPTKVRLDVVTGLANGNGIDQCEPLSMQPENRIVYDPTLYGKALDYNKFENYRLLPALIAYGNWDGETDPGTRVFSAVVAPTYVNRYGTGTTPNHYVNYEVTHLANLANFFYLWRGSIKYTLYIFTSKFITGRCVIKWLPDPTYSGALANDEFGDVVSHVIDFTGDTKYSFTIPWLRERAWEIVPDMASCHAPISDWDGFNGQITLETISPLAISDGTGEASVYFAIYASGGADFQVSRPRELPDIYTDGSISEIRTTPRKSVRKFETKRKGK
jgi:hypothetical protein